MTAYNRRRLLRDMGFLTASLATPWPIACKCNACNDLYLILEGPWLISITHPLFMRAITTNMTGHSYNYFDPRDPGNEGCHQGLGTCRMTNFDVRPHCNKLHSQTERNELFQAMYDQAQGIFYTSDVTCPGTFDCSLKALELQLSYPDEIIPMSLHTKIRFRNFDCVKNGNVDQWPSALLLRYKEFKSAVFSGDQCGQENLDPSKGEVHRKLSITVAPYSLDNCTDVSRAEQNALCHFASIMGLLEVKGKKLPVPQYPTCTGTGDEDPITRKHFGPITEAEMSAQYPPIKLEATDLVNCAAGGGGVVGHG